jgi:hypothetical protein
VVKEVGREVEFLIRTLLSEHERQGEIDLEAMEGFVRDKMLQCGAMVLSHVLSCEDRKGLTPTCSCGGTWRTIKCGDKTILTVLGEVRIRRHMQRCSGCGDWRAAEDEVLDIRGTRFSPGVRRMMARTGEEMSFDKAREMLWELGRVRVTAKDIERKAEEIGAHIHDTFEVGMREALLGDTEVVGEEGPALLYIETDGTGVPVVKMEVVGRKGKGPDGSARTREVKLGAVFTQSGVNEKNEPVRDSGSTSYLARIETAESFGNRLYAEAIRRGLGKAGKVVVLGDGAAWIWGMAALHFPMAVQVVDYYHAAEHLWELAKCLFSDEAKRTTWVDDMKARLWDGDVEGVLEGMKSMRLASVKKEARDRVAVYFETNKDRMRYADFRSQGLFIGSGVIEAGCKSLVAQRLKRSGMRWTVRGANAILALRCCIASGRFEDYWENRRAA